MSALATTTFGETLVETDVSTIPAEPPPEIVYKHRVKYIQAVKNLFEHREIIYTLAERDFRAQYKQAVLGILWAVISPVLTLIVFVVVFSRVKIVQGARVFPTRSTRSSGSSAGTSSTTALGNGGSSLLNNKALLAKTQFPRGVLSAGDRWASSA